MRSLLAVGFILGWIPSTMAEEPEPHGPPEFAALSYRSVGIPPARIFTIDPAGDVKLELMPTYKST